MKYTVKIEVPDTSCQLNINAENEREAVVQAINTFCNLMKLDAPGALACGAITWTVEHQPTLYEQVKAICEGDGIGVFGGTWQKRQTEIYKNHFQLWRKSENKAEEHELFSHSVTDEEFSHLLCSYALQIAKES